MQNEVEFLSHGVTCRGWLCSPTSKKLRTEEGYPALVMAPGTSGVREQLERYIPRFTAAGMYVLVFDYRHFGASDGEPRQLLSIGRQLQDYEAALKFIRRVPGVDSWRIAIWGTSLAGGHVVDVAVKDEDVAAVVAQAPIMDNYAVTLRLMQYAGFSMLMRLTWLGFVDLICSLFRLTPRLIPAGAPPGDPGWMTTPDTLPGLKAIAVPGWRNELCARVAITAEFHRPVLKAHRLPCPVLIAICDQDSIAVPSISQETARRAGRRATLRRYPIGHFDIYVGQWFERAVADQVAFLENTLARDHVPHIRLAQSAAEFPQERRFALTKERNRSAGAVSPRQSN